MAPRSQSRERIGRTGFTDDRSGSSTATSDGRWDGAAGALARLIYDEGAIAVVGALDGRTAHVAEQVMTRARGRAVFVTPWASEATLTRIRIPWFFSVRLPTTGSRRA